MAAKKTIKVAAVPPTKPLDYVLWDGTKAIDSQVLGKGLSRLGWTNQVDPSAQFAVKAPTMPAVLQPAGASGFDIDQNLLQRGMFEFPQAVLGKQLQGDSAGHAGSLIAVSGHGVPGFMFSESLLPLAMSRPMSTTATTWSQLPGNWSYEASPTWPAKTKVAIFSACRQLQGTPQQFYWSQTMRGSDPLHALLSYRETGPSADVSAGINERFLHSLAAGKTFLKAWKGAHAASSLSYRWAALCHEAAVDDTLIDWMTLGAFPARPNSKGKILYFDADTPAGREVLPVTPDVDCWLTERGHSPRVCPWFRFEEGAALDFHVRILARGEQFQPEDQIVVIASQVRPDYWGPFSIENVVRIVDHDRLTNGGLLKELKLVHGGSENAAKPSERFGADAYEITYRPGPSMGHVQVSGPEMTIPITVGASPNGHIPLFYFYVAVRNSNGRRFGFAKEMPVEDRFQYGMFLLPEGRDP